MKKLRIKLMITVEYKVDTKWYQEGASADDIIAVEIANFTNDPMAVMQMVEDMSGAVDARGELLEDFSHISQGSPEMDDAVDRLTEQDWVDMSRSAGKEEE